MHKIWQQAQNAKESLRQVERPADRLPNRTAGSVTGMFGVRKFALGCTGAEGGTCPGLAWFERASQIDHLAGIMGIDMKEGVMHREAAAHVWVVAPAWLRHVFVAIAYCTTITLFREILIPHWVPLCGFQLAVLLLARYRYWPALVAGEMAYLALQSTHYVAMWGGMWACMNLVPTSIFIAPVAFFVREKWRVLPSPATLDVGALLVSALLVSALVTVNSMVILLTMRLPAGYGAIDYKAVVSRWLLGNYLGVLTVVPTVIFSRQFLAGTGDFSGLIKKIRESRLIAESAFLVVPVLAFLVCAGLMVRPETQLRQIFQLAMFLPVVWFSLRHGWAGAAVSGTASSFSIVALMPENYDQGTLQAELIVAFVISTMLLMGARIARLDRSVQQERNEMKQALALAQRNVNMGEMQLQIASAALVQVRENIQSACMAMNEKLRALHPSLDGKSYEHHVLLAQDQLYRLADTLYPSKWQESGLLVALREGPVPRSLDEAGINFWCNFYGDVDSLSSSLQITIYRLICEAVVDGCLDRGVTEIGARLRCGTRDGRRWVVIVASFHIAGRAVPPIRWSGLLPRVKGVASGLGLKAIQDRVTTFEGVARERFLANGERRLSMIFFDPVS